MNAARIAILIVLLGACGMPPEEAPAPEGTPGATTVQLCDGHTTAEIPAGTPVNRETGAAVSRELMAQWTAHNPEREWETDPHPAHAIVPPHDNRDVRSGESTQGAVNTYGEIGDLEVVVWERETARFVAEGDRVFHDATALGSTIAVSCDMCHPHAANTHPETYPKYQVQLGRVALLRDMINWCIEHPVRGPRMEPDDPRMRAMEAYILSQRSGVALAAGRR